MTGMKKTYLTLKIYWICQKDVPDGLESLEYLIEKYSNN